MAIDTPIDLSDDELDTVTGGTGATPGIGATATSIQGMDLETMMMTVQSQRADALTTQLTDQIAGVQARNQQVSQLGGVLSTFNQTIATAPVGADASRRMTDGDGFVLNANGVRTSENLIDEFARIGLDANKARNLNLGDLKSAVQTTQTSIDALTNSAQLDQLRLQSMANKRNEAFDLMTDFIQKMQDSRSSIVGNMR